MATDKKKNLKDPNLSAHEEAEKDMLQDAELSDPDPTDDLDEGELAQRDNSDEEALDYLERPRGKAGRDEEKHGREGHSGKGREK